MRDEYDNVAEKIVDDRIVRHKNHVPSKKYLVQWCGLPKSKIHWESFKKLWLFEELIQVHKAS